MQRTETVTVKTRTTVTLTVEDLERILREHLGMSEKASVDFDIAHGRFMREVVVTDVVETTTEGE